LACGVAWSSEPTVVSSLGSSGVVAVINSFTLSSPPVPLGCFMGFTGPTHPVPLFVFSACETPCKCPTSNHHVHQC
jgi:hypothetical protein